MIANIQFLVQIVKTAIRGPGYDQKSEIGTIFGVVQTPPPCCGAPRRIAPRGRLERINPAVHYERSSCPLEQVCDRCWPPWADPRDFEGRDFCSGGAVWVRTLGRACWSGLEEGLVPI